MRYSILIGLLISSISCVNAQTVFTSVQGGAWEDCNTWGTCPGAVAGVDYPSRTDDVVLNHRIVVNNTGDNGSTPIRPNELGFTNVCGGCVGPDGACNTPGGCNANQFYQNGKITINSGGELEVTVAAILGDTVQVNGGGILDMNGDVFIIGFINGEVSSDISFGDDIVISGNGVINSDEDFIVADDLTIDGDDAAICGNSTVTLLNTGGGNGAELRTYNQSDDETLDQICDQTTIVCNDGNCCGLGDCTTDLAGTGTDGEISSGDGTADPEVVLPIDLISFTGIVEQDFIRLNWTTGSELDNDYFEIMRSDASGSKTKIATIKGSGTTQNLNNYSYLDKEAVFGELYYTLSQVDFDGQYEVFEPIRIQRSPNKDFKIEAIKRTALPNSIQLSLRLVSDQPIQYTLFDLSGKIISSRTVPASVTLNIPCPNQAHGNIYVFSISQGNASLRQKIAIQ